MRLLALLYTLYGLAQLVGARGWFLAAAYALQACDNLIGVHAFYEARDALEVAMATSNKMHVVKFVVVGQVEQYLDAACALCLVIEHVFLITIYELRIPKICRQLFAGFLFTKIVFSDEKTHLHREFLAFKFLSFMLFNICSYHINKKQYIYCTIGKYT